MAQSLTDSPDNTQYVTKVSTSLKVMAAAPGSCSSLDVADVTTTYPALTSSDIKAVGFTWADKPTVTDAPKVIDGVVQ